jgi:outer membrane protein assembly factor BamD
LKTQNSAQYSFHKAAQIALDLFISDYPVVHHTKRMLLLKLDSAYKLAVNSIPQKMEERLVSAKSAYSSLISSILVPKYKTKADEMLAKIERFKTIFLNKMSWI